MKRNPFAEKFSTTKIPSLGISLTTYYLGDKLAYKMYVDGKILFKGDDFKPGAFYNWDDLETNVSLLGFLSIGVGDTDNDYFKEYTADQMKWAKDERDDSIREELSLLISDFEDKSSEYHTDSVIRFKHKTF